MSRDLMRRLRALVREENEAAMRMYRWPADKPMLTHGFGYYRPAEPCIKNLRAIK